MICTRQQHKKLNRSLTQKQEFYRYIAEYTLIFCGICLFLFSRFIASQKTLIWASDGWDQHYKALYYFRGTLLDTICRFFKTGQLVMPTYDFALGQGGDVIQVLSFYVIGDPFAFLSVLCPVDFLPFFYGFLVWLRLYLAGLSFSALCFYKRQYSEFAVLAGTISYLFGAWGISNAVRHPFFMNPMIYFPLIILGLEKIFHNEKPYWFIFGVFLAAISQFYFFYVTVLIVIIYVVVRWSTVYGCSEKFRVGCICFLKIFVYSLLAVCAAAILVLPSIYTFLADSRLDSVTASTDLFYPVGYYAKMFSGWIKTGADYKLYLGYSAAFLPCLILLFRKKKQHTDLKIFFILGCVCVLFPIFGEIFNGFSYASNRWSFALALLVSYSITVMWKHLFSLSVQDKIRLVVFFVLYAVVCLVVDPFAGWSLYSALILCAVFILTVLFYRPKEGDRYLRAKQILSLSLVILSVINMAYWTYSDAGSGAARQCVSFAKAADADAGVGEAVRTAAEGDETFYRFAGSSISNNTGLVLNLSSTHSFWSLSNASVSEMCKQMGILETRTQIQKSYDRRETLLSLASVKYFVAASDEPALIPYGFERVDTTSREWDVYKNAYALPLGYTYDRILTKDNFEKLSSVEKEEAILQGAYLEEYDGAVESAVPQLNTSDVGYTLQSNDRHAVIQDGKIVTTKPNTCVDIVFHTPVTDNLYVLLEGLDFSYTSAYDLYYGSNEVDPLNLYTPEQGNRGTNKQKHERLIRKIYQSQPSYTTLELTPDDGNAQQFKYFTPHNSYYTDAHDFTVPFSVNENGVKKITVTFEQRGVYSFDRIRVVSRSMNRYTDDIRNRTQDILEDVEIGDNTVRGTITTETDKILYLAIPYADGWTATVDGRTVSLYRANLMHMALDVGAGRHTVELHYHTPLLKEGACLSLISIVLLLPTVLFVWPAIRRKRHK